MSEAIVQISTDSGVIPLSVSKWGTAVAVSSMGIKTGLILGFLNILGALVSSQTLTMSIAWEVK